MIWHWHYQKKDVKKKWCAFIWGIYENYTIGIAAKQKIDDNQLCKTKVGVADFNKQKW